jgi:hypothetical protein
MAIKIYSYTIEKIVEGLRDNYITISEWHRDAQWRTDYIETYFYHIFQNNQLGAIIVTENNNSNSRKYGDEFGTNSNHYSEFVIIDGNKRLHAIVQSINDEIKNNQLFFYKLFGDGKERNPFKFFALNEKSSDDNWISVNLLYKKFRKEGVNYNNVIKEINKDNSPIVSENLFKFYYNFFYSKNIMLISIGEEEKETFNSVNERGYRLTNSEILKYLFKSIGNQFEKFVTETEKYLTIDIKRDWSYLDDKIKGTFFSIISIIFYIYHNGKQKEIFNSNLYLDWLLNETENIESFFNYDLLIKVVEKCFAIMYITQIRIYDEPEIAYFLYKELKEDINRNLKDMFIDYVLQKFEHLFVSKEDARIFAHIYAEYATKLHKIEFRFPYNLPFSFVKDSIYDLSTNHPIKVQGKCISFDKTLPWNTFEENSIWQKKEENFYCELTKY